MIKRQQDEKKSLKLKERPTITAQPEPEGRERRVPEQPVSDDAEDRISRRTLAFKDGKPGGPWPQTLETPNHD